MVQSNLLWEDISGNLKQFTEKFDEIKDEPDIIVLPEMFTTGFTMNSIDLAENMQEKTMAWLAKESKRLNCAISAGFIAHDIGKIFNRHVWMLPDGSYEFYDKRHLFRMGNEHEYYSPGQRKVIVQYKGWNIRLLTCYDLRFPVWSRNRNDYDIAIYIANWPEKRREAWMTLLAARAMENQCYVVGVNRVGTDDNNIVYSGDSTAFSPKGIMITDLTPYKENILIAEASKKELEEFRMLFPAWMDADDFEFL